MAITITKHSSSGNVKITRTGQPDFWIMGQFYCVMTCNDAQTHVIIRDGDFDVKLLLTDITLIDTVAGPFTMSDALDRLNQHIFVK